MQREHRGFAGVGSIMDTEIPESVASTKSMVFTFGPTGSFGYCSAAPQQQRVLSWWSNWGTTDLPKGNVMDTEEIRRQLNERHGTWKDPVIQHIIKTMNTDRIYPVWSMPDLPFWGERGAVLIGDAAHALRAMSGQGACQALEDTVTLCLLLQHYVAESNKPDSQVTTKEAIALASKALYKIRSPRTSAIRDKSRRMYVSKAPINNVVLEYLWYLMIHLLLRYSWIGEPFSASFQYHGRRPGVLHAWGQLLTSPRLSDRGSHVKRGRLASRNRGRKVSGGEAPMICNHIAIIFDRFLFNHIFHLLVRRLSYPFQKSSWGCCTCTP